MPTKNSNVSDAELRKIHTMIADISAEFRLLAGERLDDAMADLNPLDVCVLEYAYGFEESTEQVIRRVEQKFDDRPTPETLNSVLERATDAVAKKLGVEPGVAATLIKVNRKLARLKGNTNSLG
jgi:hypothetical protein